MAKAIAQGAFIEKPAAGQVLHDGSERLVDRDLRFGSAARVALQQDLPDLGEYVVIVDQAGSLGLEEFGRLAEGGGAVVHEEPGARHKLSPQFRRPGATGSDRVHVAAGGDIASVNDRILRGGCGADDISVADRLGRRLGDPNWDRKACPDARGERAGPFRRASPDGHRLDVAHQRNGRQVRLRLFAAAKDREARGVPPRQGIRRNRARRGRPDRRYLRRGEDADRCPAHGVEQADEPLMGGMSPRARRLKHRDQLGAETLLAAERARHQAKHTRAGFQRHDLSQILLSLTLRERAHRRVDQRYGHRRGKVRPHIFAAYDQQ